MENVTREDKEAPIVEAHTEEVDGSTKVIEESKENENINSNCVCVICDESFGNQTLLSNHMDNHEVIPQIDGNIECNITPVFIPELSSHFWWFCCDECSDKFTQETDFKKHKMLKHNPNKPYVSKKNRKKNRLKTVLQQLP